MSFRQLLELYLRFQNCAGDGSISFSSEVYSGILVSIESRRRQLGTGLASIVYEGKGRRAGSLQEVA